MEHAPLNTIQRASHLAAHVGIHDFNDDIIRVYAFPAHLCRRFRRLCRRSHLLCGLAFRPLLLLLFLLLLFLRAPARRAGGRAGGRTERYFERVYIQSPTPTGMQCGIALSVACRPCRPSNARGCWPKREASTRRPDRPIGEPARTGRDTDPMKKARMSAIFRGRAARQSRVSSGTPCS